MHSTFISDVTERTQRLISPQLLSEALHVSLSELSRLAGVHRNTLTRRPASAVVQERLGLIVRIVSFAEQLTGDSARAVVWFLHQPLVGFENETAADLVAGGHGQAVLAHLDMLADGVHA